MRIRKIATSIGVLGKILNSKSSSKQDTYSCDYINNMIKKFNGSITTNINGNAETPLSADKTILCWKIDGSYYATTFTTLSDSVWWIKVKNASDATLLANTTINIEIYYI